MYKSSSLGMRRLGLRKNVSQNLKHLAIGAILSLVASHSAWAASGTWTNGGADNNWQSASNWSPGMPGATSGFTSTDTAIFTTVGSGTINLGNLINVQSISFGAGSANANGFVIGDANDTLNLSNSGTTLMGTGVTSTQQIGVVGTTINLANGATQSYAFTNNSATSSAKLNVAGNVVGNSTGVTTLTLGGANGGTVSGNISVATGTLAVTKTGAGTWALTGSNAYNGATTVNGGGTLDIGGSSSTGSITGSTLALGSSVTWFGGKLSYTRTGANTQAFASTALNAGASTIENLASSGTITLGAITRAAGGVVSFTGPGSITTSSPNSNGILGGYATFGDSTWAVANGAGSAITGLSSYTPSTSGTTAPGTTSNVDFQASNVTAWNTQTVNSLRFNTATAATLTVNSGQTLTATSGGILVTSTVGNNLSLITGGTITAGSSALIVHQNNTANGLEIALVIAGSGQEGLTKTGAGTLTLSGANTFTGRIYVHGGMLKLGNAQAFGDPTSATNFVVFSAGTTLDLNGFSPNVAAGKTFNFLGSSIINSNSTSVTFANGWSGLGTSADGFVNTIGGVGNITFSGAINGGRLVKTGSNTMMISGAVNNVGTTLQANSGTSILNSSVTDGALRGIDGSGNVLTVNTGASVVLGANDQIRAADTNTGIVAVYGGTFDINSKSDTINGLQIGSTDGSTSGNVISTGGSGTLTVTGPSTVLGTNKILATNGTASANLAGSTTSLTKNTSGTVALSGANTYGAGTTVSLGTLLANTPVSGTNSATGTGAVTVSASAVLGGTGQIRPTGANGISVASGGYVAPGASVGTLTIDSGGSTATNILTMSAGSGFRFELGTGGTFSTPGTSDLLVIANSAIGDVVFNSNNIDFLGGGSTGTYLIFDGLSSALESSDSWVGLTLGGVSGREIISGLSVTNLGSGLTGTLYLGDGAAFGNAGDIYLNVVPEPSTYALFAGGLGIIAFLRRRKSS